MSEEKKFFEEFEYPSYEQWKKAAIEALKGVPFDKKMYTKTYEEITLDPIYNKADIENLPFADSLPGFFPFVRGTDPAGYRLDSWEVAQELPYACPHEFNKSAKIGLAGGQTVLNINSDIIWGGDKATFEDVPKNKLALNSIGEMNLAFEDIDLEKTPVYLNGDEISYVHAALYFAYLKEKGINMSKVKSFFGIDPIGVLAREGKLYDQVNKYYDQAANLVNWSKINAPNTRALLVDTSVYHNGGGSIIHELAAALATGAEYIRQMLDRGIKINEVASTIWFKFSIGPNFFMEIAKFRAFKMLWAKVVSAFKGNEDACKAYIHADTSWRTNTKYDPYVNMLRNSSQGFSAVVGGISSMNVLPFSDKHTAPDEFANRTARNTQNVLNEEAHLKDAIDPAGGSWYIESITDELAKSSWEYFQKIETDGIFEFLKKGTIQSDILTIATLRDKNLSTRKDVILGTNKYPNVGEAPLKTTPVDKEIIAEVINNFTDRYNKRKTVNANALTRFEDLIEQLAAGAYVYDIVYGIFGDIHKIEATRVEPLRSADLFEKLRDAAKEYEEQSGKKATIHFACYGLLRQYKPRADFSTDFFQTGGFTTEIIDGFDNPEAMIRKLKNLDSKVIVFCSTDPQYEEFIPQVASELKKENPLIKLIVAGYPKDKIDEYTKAGVDEFIHVRANIYTVISNLQKAMF